MEEYTQITLDEWTQWKEDIRKKLQETAGNFVYIGYRLKQIRESGMFDGAADIFEFAQNEYGLGKSTVSRFIAINEKYSEGGNSLELREEFRGFSSSKLSEMLTLSDAECMLITEKTTVKQIRELKQFDKEEPVEETVIDEVPAEQTSEEGQQDKPERKYSPLEKCIVDYFKDRKKMLNTALMAIREEWNEKEIVEIINPSGAATHKKGLCFLFMYDQMGGVKYKLYMDPQPVSMTWADFLADIWDIYKELCTEGREDIHSAFYGTEKPVENVEKTAENQGSSGSVATSQQEKEKEEKPAEIKDIPEATTTTEEAPEEVEKEIAEAAVEEEEQSEGIPGQMAITPEPIAMNLPEPPKEMEESEEQRKIRHKHMEEIERGVMEDIEALRMKMTYGSTREALRIAEGITESLRTLKKLEEKDG